MADNFPEAAAAQRAAQELLDSVRAVKGSAAAGVPNGGATAMLDKVARAKRQAALRNPQTDTSRETAATAKRTW